MLYGVKYVAKYLLGLDIADRSMAVYPDDTFITSYPRSGNTWTRFLIANLIHAQEPVTFANIESVIPDATALSNQAMKRVSRPRMVKTHEYFDPRYRKVIYLVRDPRDVAVSLYHFRRKNGYLEDSYPLESYVRERFIPGDMDVSWGEHVGSWLGARRNDPRLLLVRYEDLQQSTFDQVLRIAHFLGIEAASDRVRTAIERSDLDRMRRLEREEHEKWITTKGRRKDVPFIGAGKSGKWGETLPKAAAALIESQWYDLMRSLGYEPGAQPASRTEGLAPAGS
jgi:hypothetical protein